MRLGDVDRRGRLRLDALARYLQDVATDDADDAGLGDGWVLRRLGVRVTSWARFRDSVHLTTWCSGAAGSVAERRTRVELDGGVAVDALALWVFVGNDGRPRRLDRDFFARYGIPTDVGRLPTRLRHDAPLPEAPEHPWPLRRTDFDVLGHVNNAVHWGVVDEVMQARWPRQPPVYFEAELEYRVPIEPGESVAVVVADDDGGCRVWLRAGPVVKASATTRWR